MADLQPTLVGTARTVCGSRVTIHAGRLDWRAHQGMVLVVGGDVVLGVVDSAGRRPCRVQLPPAQAVRLAALLLAPVHEQTFSERVEHVQHDEGHG